MRSRPSPPRAMPGSMCRRRSRPCAASRASRDACNCAARCAGCASTTTSPTIRRRSPRPWGVLRHRVGSARIIAVLEPRSRTMRMGVHRVTLVPALAGADEVWVYTPPDLGWDTGAVLSTLGARAHASADVTALAHELARAARSGDHVLIMSNGGFGGLHDKLLAELRRPA